jgi:hypothetical protein
MEQIVPVEQVREGVALHVREYSYPIEERIYATENVKALIKRLKHFRFAINQGFDADIRALQQVMLETKRKVH